MTEIQITFNTLRLNYTMCSSPDRLTPSFFAYFGVLFTRQDNIRCMESLSHYNVISRRTSHLSISALQELVKGRDGELAVGREIINSGKYKTITPTATDTFLGLTSENVAYFLSRFSILGTLDTCVKCEKRRGFQTHVLLVEY